jgi:drug/metabolite transporter (DMT)-like permease
VRSRSGLLLGLAAGVLLIAAVLMLVDALTSGGVVSWLAFAFFLVAACFYAAMARSRLGNRAERSPDEPSN